MKNQRNVQNSLSRGKRVSRRSVLAGAAAVGAGALVSGFGAPPTVFAQTKMKVRIGYLKAIPVDGQMWLMDHLGTYAKEGLEPEFTRFHTGIEGFTALVGGSIDFITTGGVTHNFPARGQGIVVLPNGVEVAGQVWAQPDSGIKTLADLKGRQVATTKGTTGQIFLHAVMNSVGLKSTEEVELVSQTMPAAVTSFIAGRVPALSTWVPFNIRVRDEMSGAVLVANAPDFYPETGFVITAYSTNKQTLEGNPDLIKRLVAAWGPANEMIRTQRDESIQVLHEKYYSEVAVSDLHNTYDAVKFLPASEWAKQVDNGELHAKLDQVTDILVDIGAMKSPLKAAQYSDFSVFKSAYGG